MSEENMVTVTVTNLQYTTTFEGSLSDFEMKVPESVANDPEELAGWIMENPPESQISRDGDVHSEDIQVIEVHVD